jgi:hypothetical protein
MSGSEDMPHAGSFAEGVRTLPHSEADHVAGHFSEGAEQDHDALAAMRGSFSDGDLAMHAAHERVGSFGDSDCPVCRAKAAEAAAG